MKTEQWNGILTDELLVIDLKKTIFKINKTLKAKFYDFLSF